MTDGHTRRDIVAGAVTGLFIPPHAAAAAVVGKARPLRWRFSSPSTAKPAIVYADAALTTPLGWSIAPDATGRFPPVFLRPDAAYRASLVDADDRAVQTLDLSQTRLGDTALFEPAGRGAKRRPIQAKLREIGISPMDFGAVGDAAADDTTAVQAAVDVCLATPGAAMPLRVDGRFRLTRSVLIDRPADRSGTRFLVIGNGLGAGFHVTGDIDLFDTRLPVTTDPLCENILFQNITFSADSNQRRAQTFAGGKFLRMTFAACEWIYLRCLASPLYAQSWHFRSCRANGWRGEFFASRGVYDLTAQFETKWGETMFYLVDQVRPVMRARIHDGVYELNGGPVVECANAAGLSVDGNYFERNRGPTLQFGAGGANQTISVSNNTFVPVDQALGEPDFFDIIWGETRRGFATGNYCTGRLHDTAQMTGPDQLLTIAGDVAEVELYHGFVAKSAARRPRGNVQIASDGQSRLSWGGRFAAVDATLGGLAVGEDAAGTVRRLLWGERNPQTDPAAYGDIVWGAGSRVLNIAPAPGRAKGWICVASGKPGVWTSEGDL